MDKKMDTLSISHRTAGLAIKLAERLLDIDMNEHPELLLGCHEELYRLQRAHKRVEEEMNV